MNPYRKRFEANTAFPFACVYRDTKTAQAELPDHLHDWYELVYVYNGHGTFFIDQTIYSAQAGDIFLIPGNTIHRSFPDPDDPKTSTALFFNPTLLHTPSLGDPFTYLRCFEQADRAKSYKLASSEAERRELEALIEAIRLEEQEQKRGYRHAVLNLLQRMLLLLGRRVASPEPTQTGRAPDWMADALTYIDEYPAEQLGLSQLAERANVTAAHFSRVFKKLTGMNVTEYVTTKRILRAKKLLTGTADSVAAIALGCGFESVPHFHRMFKKLTGMTPAQYKKNE